MTVPRIDVRPIRIRDLLRLRSMRADALMPDQSNGPLGQRMPDPWAVLPGSRRTRRSFVAFVDGSAAGLVDLIADPANHRWVLSRVLTSRNVPSDEREFGRERVWQEMMLQAIRSAGLARIKRIHAVLDDEAPIIESLIQTGFSQYAQDTVMTSPMLSSDGPTGLIRRQDPSDVWAIHQLYHSVTPRPVQYSEALTSNYWSRVVPGQQASRGYVVEDGLEVVAHCRVTFGRNGPTMNVMVAPDALELVCPVVQEVAADVGRQNNGRYSVVVPDYLQEYGGQLAILGFEPSRRQTRLVKHTVVARRMQFRGVEELVKDSPERVAAGSPGLYYVPAGRSDSTRSGAQSTREQHERS